MKRHVMLDLETLGTKPGCPIISIGAVCFLNEPLDQETRFYVTLDPVSAEGIMDKPDPDTLSWWANQSKEARGEVFNNPNSRDFIAGLHLFKRFLGQLLVNDDDEIVIWGNGASFDEPILLEAYARCHIPVPWSYRNSRCYRTLTDLGAMIGIKQPPFAGVKHNALADATHQAKVALRIINAIVTLSDEEI